MTPQKYQEFTKLNEKIFDCLKKVRFDTNLEETLVTLHKQWLCFTFTNYTTEVHRNLAQMYLDDERFEAYYDVAYQGATKVLVSAIKKFTLMWDQEGFLKQNKNNA